MSSPVVLIETQQLASRVAAMAAEIRATLPDDDIHFVCVLKGAFLFLADLVRALDDRVTSTSSRCRAMAPATQSSGEVRLVKDLDASLEGRDVVIVEDIVDTGLTLHYLQDILRARGPCRCGRPAC